MRFLPEKRKRSIFLLTHGVPALPSMASLGTDGITIDLPKGFSADDVSTTTGPNGEAVVTATKTLNEVEFTVKGDTDLTGAKIKASEVEIKASSKTDTVSLTVDSSSFKKSEIVVTKGNANIAFNTSVKKSDITCGKGDDKITFGANSKVKKCTVDLGKKGTDSVVFEANKISGKLTVTNLGKGDSVTVGSETTTYKEFKDGAEIKGLNVELN